MSAFRVEYQRSMDLIREDRHPVGRGQRGHGVELGRGERPSHRVPRVAQHEQTGPGVHGGLDAVKVQLPSGRAVGGPSRCRGDLDAASAVTTGNLKEGCVGGGGDDDGGGGSGVRGDDHAQ